MSRSPSILYGKSARPHPWVAEIRLIGVTTDERTILRVSIEWSLVDGAYVKLSDRRAAQLAVLCISISHQMNGKTLLLGATRWHLQPASWALVELLLGPIVPGIFDRLVEYQNTRTRCKSTRDSVKSTRVKLRHTDVFYSCGV